MINTVLHFNRGKKKYKFDLVHNLDECGLSIDAALLCWSVRTKIFTIESFCKYVCSKDSYIICVPVSKLICDICDKKLLIKDMSLSEDGLPVHKTCEEEKYKQWEERSEFLSLMDRGE